MDNSLKFSNVRKKIALDYGWRFHKGDIPFKFPYWGWTKAGICNQGASGKVYDDSGWLEVDLPHDFLLDECYTKPEEEEGTEPGVPGMWNSWNTIPHTNHGMLKGGIAWYRKTFIIPEDDDGKRIYLVFDGVFRNSRIFINDFYVGDHMSGYTGIFYDVTDFIDYGGRNTVAVRVDASEYEGWYYEGGGIYRHAWLIKVNPIHVANNGIFVHTDFNPERKGCANVFIKSTLYSRCERQLSLSLVSRIISPDGKIAAEVTSEGDMPAWGDMEFSQQAAVKDPVSWSLESPSIYKVCTEIYHNGELIDSYESDFGIRSMQFDKDKGFLLNGRQVKLKGMCCHQDHAGLGIAVPDSIQEYRIRMLKEMGCNAYRCSHHPPSPELLEICDRLGMLVMAENRIFSSAPENIRQLESMITACRNHPSVFIWSLGNEEGRVQFTLEGKRIGRTLRNIVKRLDPTRPVTLAVCLWSWLNKKELDLETVLPVMGEMDVAGFNYADNAWIKYHEIRPDQPVVITEATSESFTRGCYKRDDAKGHLACLDQSDQNLQWSAAAFAVEEQWDKVSRNDFLSGIFIWTGFDYRGEPSPQGWPAISSHFGVMDTCGFPKDRYYYYKSQWTDEPMVYLFPHWNGIGEEGKPSRLFCYSNCDEVELLVNGVSFGRKAVKKHYHLEWENPVYNPGMIKAVGYKDGKQCVEFELMTGGAPFAVRLKPDRTAAKADGRDAVIINAEIIDDKGLVVPTACNEVTFTLEGAGKIIGTGNGNPSSHESDRNPHRCAFNGYCQVIAMTGNKPGELKLTAVSPGLYSDTATINVR